MLKMLFASVALISVAVSPASAQQPRHEHLTPAGVYQIDFRDLDLNDSGARAELMRRITLASQIACDADPEMTRGEIKRCVRASVQRAVASAPGAVRVALGNGSAYELARR